MEQTEVIPSYTLEHFLRVYKIEPIGYVFIDRLHLPIPIVWFLFVFVNFGVRLIMHIILGTPTPITFGDIFRLPPNFYYYPNLIAVTFDLIGIPLILTLLVFFRSYIPTQFLHLKQSSFISEKSTASRIHGFLTFVGTSKQIQILAIIILPLLIAISGLFIDIWLYSPQDTPARYALFQSFLGRYARVAIFFQLVYIFIVLSNYEFKFRLYFHHPDECSGLASFGNLAISAYAYLFAHAMMQAISTVAGGSGFEKAFRSIAGSVALVYLWIIFPLALVLVFSELIYKPHKVLQQLQKNYLWTASLAWTNYHQKLTSNIKDRVEQIEEFTDKFKFHFEDDLGLLETWMKLNKYVQDMHTWPIPKRTFRIIAILTNPLIPLFLPVIVDGMRGFFS